MKNLLVSALMLSTMALSAAAAGTYDYCSAGSRILSNRNVAMEDDLTSYRGVNCETDPKVIITFDATKAPNGFGITGTFSDGTIGAGGAINIKGPGQSSVENTAPILIRIERNIFATDAIMYITGSFPTSSLISISNNEFNVGNRHDLLVGINTNFISAITFGDYETEQLLYTNAQVTVFSNAIQVEDRSGDAQPFEVYGVYASSHIYMSNEAGFLIQRNNITGGSQVKAVGVYCPRYCFMMGNNTLAQITANRVELTNGVLAHTPAISVAGEYHTTADFSQNTARLTPVHSLTYALILGPINVTAYSSVEIADNVILNVNSGDGAAALSTRIFVNGPIQTRDHAGVYIWFNTMDTQGGSPQMAFGAPITIQQQSRVWFVGNQMERKEGLILGLAPIYMAGLSLENEGNFVLSQNVFGSGNINSKPLFVTLASNAPMYKSENATFDICRNKWYGEEFASTSMLTSSLSPAVRPMITDLSQCPAEITTTTSTAPPTTTTTTTTTGTTVPEDNANAAPAVSSVVAAFAVVAAALVLLA